MKVEDSRGFYEFRITHLTWAGEQYHPAFGHCFKKIYRYIGDDNGTTAQHTLDTLKKNEPDVGMWPGDRVEYWDKDGNMLARYTC